MKTASPSLRTASIPMRESQEVQPAPAQRTEKRTVDPAGQQPRADQLAPPADPAAQARALGQVNLPPPGRPQPKGVPVDKVGLPVAGVQQPGVQKLANVVDKLAVPEAQKYGQGLGPRGESLPNPVTTADPGAKASDGVVSDGEVAFMQQHLQNIVDGRLDSRMPPEQRDAIKDTAKKLLADMPALLEQVRDAGSTAKFIDGGTDARGDYGLRAGGSLAKNFTDGELVGNRDGVLSRDELTGYVKEMERRATLQPDNPQWKQRAELGRAMLPLVPE